MEVGKVRQEEVIRGTIYNKDILCYDLFCKESSRSKNREFVQESQTSFAGNSRAGIYTDLGQEAIMATRILLVDDDPNIISLLRRGLAYEGFEVYTAMGGESGLVAVEKCLPHIVLVDITMPGLDGF
jgi:CheY-like chemotaxis protein